MEAAAQIAEAIRSQRVRRGAARHARAPLNFPDEAAAGPARRKTTSARAASDPRSGAPEIGSRERPSIRHLAGPSETWRCPDPTNDPATPNKLRPPLHSEPAR